jgi:hypothetical protein
MENAKYKIGDKFRDVEEGDTYITTVIGVVSELDSEGEINYIVKIEHSAWGEPQHYFTCTTERVLGFEELIEV